MTSSLPRLEASVRTEIVTQLTNLGWVVDEKDKYNNVTQERPKTKEQRETIKQYHKTSRPKSPDFVLYQSGTSTPIGIIEAKRPGESLEKALDQAQKLYAEPLKAPLIFAYNDTFVATRHLANKRSLKIDGEDVIQFVDEATLLRFYNEGPEILAAPQAVQPSRQELIKKFRKASDLLREAGIQAGPTRFSAFSDLLFLKLIDEKCQLEEHRKEKASLPDYFRWKHFSEMEKPDEMHEYVSKTVWAEMNKKYGDVFGESMPIKDPVLFSDLIKLLNDLNLTTADSDVKGDAFEYFLKNAYQGIKLKDLGEYFTPRNIVRMMISMVDPKVGETVYDPFCGTGGFLIEAFRYLNLRVKPSKDVLKILKEKTIYGAEITDTARVAKMNMILFGDGHNNVIQQDSFANLKKNKYDIVVTNPPYSLKTNHINQYPIPTTNGDAIAVQHCFESLKETGKSRAAILIKEDFLTEDGYIGKVREYIFNSVKNMSIISLPRRIFEPYTPTKTSILYLEKQIDTTSKVFFYVVNNVGHTLGTRPKPILENDIPFVLNGFINKTTKKNDLGGGGEKYNS